MQIFAGSKRWELNDSLNTYIANEMCRVYAHPIPKSFREMEKIDRIAQHSDYPTLLSYSPRKQVAASARYIASTNLLFNQADHWNAV